MKTSRPAGRGRRNPRRRIQTARAGGHVSQTTRDMEFLKQTIESEQKSLEEFLKGKKTRRRDRNPILHTERVRNNINEKKIYNHSQYIYTVIG